MKYLKMFEELMPTGGGDDYNQHGVGYYINQLSAKEEERRIRTKKDKEYAEEKKAQEEKRVIWDCESKKAEEVIEDFLLHLKESSGYDLSIFTFVGGYPDRLTFKVFVTIDKKKDIFTGGANMPIDSAIKLEFFTSNLNEITKELIIFENRMKNHYSDVEIDYSIHNSIDLFISIGRIHTVS